MTSIDIYQLEPELQQVVVDDYTFKNWSNTFTCKPELFFRPRTENQVQKVNIEQ
jgi:L-gulonolactone oxidase